MNTVQNFDTDDLEHTDLIKNTDLTLTIDSKDYSIGGIDINELVINSNNNNLSKGRPRSKKTKKNRKLLLTKIQRK